MELAVGKPVWFVELAVGIHIARDISNKLNSLIKEAYIFITFVNHGGKRTCVYGHRHNTEYLTPLLAQVMV